MPLATPLAVGTCRYCTVQTLQTQVGTSHPDWQQRTTCCTRQPWAGSLQPEHRALTEPTGLSRSTQCRCYLAGGFRRNSYTCERQVPTT